MSLGAPVRCAKPFGSKSKNQRPLIPQQTHFTTNHQNLIASVIMSHRQANWMAGHDNSPVCLAFTTTPPQPINNPARHKNLAQVLDPLKANIRSKHRTLGQVVRRPEPPSTTAWGPMLNRFWILFQPGRAGLLFKTGERSEQYVIPQPCDRPSCKSHPHTEPTPVPGIRFLLIG